LRLPASEKGQSGQKMEIDEQKENVGKTVKTEANQQRRITLCDTFAPPDFGKKVKLDETRK